MTTEIRRPISRAASTSRSDAWRFASACSTQDPDEFFSTATKDLADNKALCLSCPVITQCLTATLTQESGRYRFGIHGGLTPAQRLALVWEERLHGHRPNLETAQLLVTPRWRYVLYNLSRLTPEAAARRLGEAGIDTDAVTVRLALWWIGRPGNRLRQRVTRKEPETNRLLRLHTPLIRQLRALGATHQDVAAYFGAPEPLVGRAVARLEKADKAALETTEMEMAA